MSIYDYFDLGPKFLNESLIFYVTIRYFRWSDLILSLDNFSIPSQNYIYIYIYIYIYMHMCVYVCVCVRFRIP